MSRRKTTADRRDKQAAFVRALPLSSWMKFYAAVFFTFAPVFVLLGGGVNTDGTWGAIFFWSFWSGLIGAAWAYAFTRGTPKLLFIIIPAQALLIVLSGAGWPEAFALRGQEADLSGLFIVITIVAAYALFSWFIATEGSKAFRMSEEMRLAAQIHSSLVPDIRVETDRLEIFARSVASSEMGGDLIDMVTGEDGAVTLHLADVSGHGVRAGVLMAMLKSVLRAAHLSGSSLDETVTRLNAVVDQVKEPDMFATYAALRIEPDGGVRCAIAGHLPIVRVSCASGEVTLYQNEHLPLGVVASEGYASRTIETAPGDLLAIYTDGLTEAADERGKLLGAERIHGALREWRGESLESIFEAVFGVVDGHDGAKRQDDQTLMLVRMK